MRKNLFLYFLILASTALADDLVVGGGWGGINNVEDPTNKSNLSIPDNDALFAQNIDVLDDKSAIKMRSKYYMFNGNIGISTHGIRGGYRFTTSTGTDMAVFTNDRSIYKSTNFISWTAYVTTDTSGSFYDFAENQGSLWRANSNRDQILSYNGTAVVYYPSAPLGNQIEFLPDRAIISGTAANPNRLNFSASADFTNYVTGILETDPFTEDVGLPGDAVNATKVACGGVLIFSDHSLSIWQGNNQYDGKITNISNSIGSDHPNTVIEKNGVVYFLGTYDQYYSFDCNTITNLSKKLNKNALSISFGVSGERAFSCIDSRNRIWISNPSNQSYVYNINHDSWLYNSFSSQACFIETVSGSDFVMFGGISTGAVYGIPVLAQFVGGGLDGANISGGAGGTSFTAYWQTKNYTLGDPFSEDTYNSYSILSNTPNFTLTSETNPGSDVRTISGSDTYTVNNGKYPAGTFGRTMKLKFSADSAAGSLILYAFKLNYTPRVWRVLP